MYVCLFVHIQYECVHAHLLVDVMCVCVCACTDEFVIMCV